MDKEVESYDLRLTHTNRVGGLNDAYVDHIINLDKSDVYLPYDPDGVAETRLPKGRYFIGSAIFDEDLTVESNLERPVLNQRRPAVCSTADGGAVSVTAPRSDATQYSASRLFGVTTPQGQFVWGTAAESFDSCSSGGRPASGLAVRHEDRRQGPVPGRRVDRRQPVPVQPAWAERGGSQRLHRDARTERSRPSRPRTAPDPGCARRKLGQRVPDLQFGAVRRQPMHLPFQRTGTTARPRA